MIDMIVLVSIHGLLALAAYRLTLRNDLDEDPLLKGENGTDGGEDGRHAP